MAAPGGGLPASGAHAPGAAISNSECMVCHDDPALTRVVAGRTNSLQVTEKDPRRGPSMRGLACTDCHAGIKELPHAEKLPAAAVRQLP